MYKCIVVLRQNNLFLFISFLYEKKLYHVAYIKIHFVWFFYYYFLYFLSFFLFILLRRVRHACRIYTLQQYSPRENAEKKNRKENMPVFQTHKIVVIIYYLSIVPFVPTIYVIFNDLQIILTRYLCRPLRNLIRLTEHCRNVV